MTARHATTYAVAALAMLGLIGGGCASQGARGPGGDRAIGAPPVVDTPRRDGAPQLFVAMPRRGRPTFAPHWTRRRPRASSS